MYSRKTDRLTKIMVFVLSVVLAGTCLLCAGSSAVSLCRGEESSILSDSVQKEQVKAISTTELQESLEAALDNGEEELLPSRSLARFLHRIISGLKLTGLSNLLTRNYLGNSDYQCTSSTVIISYIHHIDGKIKD